MPRKPLPDFGPVTSWEETPAVTGRPATHVDVAAGRAVFHATEGASVAIPLALPARAFLCAGGERVPVVVIQAEAVRGAKGTMESAGVRFLEGGSKLCLVRELEMLLPGMPWPQSAGIH